MYCIEHGGCFRDVLLKKIGLTFKDLNINYFNSILLLNLLSCIASMLFYIKVSKFYIFKNFDVFLIFFLISLSGMIFWGNSFLKDNFIIFAISLFLFAISENKINYKNLIIAILICFLFRPLPGYFILLSTLSYLLLDSYFYKKGNFRLFFSVNNHNIFSKYLFCF